MLEWMERPHRRLNPLTGAWVVVSPQRAQRPWQGQIEQVARPGFAIAQNENGFPKRLLKGRSARVVVTMGMPASFYSIFYRAHSLKSLERNILRFVGIGPIQESLIGMVEGKDSARKKWLVRVHELGRAGQ